MACAEQCSIGPKINRAHHRQLIFLPLEPRLCGVHGALFIVYKDSLWIKAHSTLYD